MITSTINRISNEWREYLVEVKKPTRYKEFIKTHLQLGIGNCQKITSNLWIYGDGCLSNHEWR